MPFALWLRGYTAERFNLNGALVTSPFHPSVQRPPSLYCKRLPCCSLPLQNTNTLATFIVVINCLKVMDKRLPKPEPELC